MAKVPVGMRGVMTDEPDFGQVTLIPVESSAESAPAPPNLVGIICAGEHELGISFAPVAEPVVGWDLTLGGAAGGLEIFHSARGEPEMEHTLDWRHTFGEGSALEQLLACRVLRAALEGEPVRLLEPATREQIWLLVPVEGDHADDIRDLEARERLLELVAELELWTAEPMVVPARPTEEDAKALSLALGRIRSPEVEGTWDHLRVVVDGDLPVDPVEVVALEARHATLFGSEVFLGVEQHRLPLAAATPTEDGAELRPVEGYEHMSALLHRPSEYPAEAARPPGQAAGGRVMYREPQVPPAQASNR